MTNAPINPHHGVTLGALADGHRPTDIGNADRLAALANGRIRYVHTWKKWIVYLKGAWRIDNGETLITEAAKKVPSKLFHLAATLHDPDRDAMWRWAKRSESAVAVRNMITMARGIPGIVCEHRQLDAHPWLLNVLNGELDLRTGRLLEHDPEHLLTKQAPVMFDPAAASPLWDQCLARWQPDPAVREYLQDAVGSAASGEPVERFIVFRGDGGNGKGKFFGAITSTLGPGYVVVPHKSLIIAQRYDEHDTVRARLNGARMVVAAETDPGDRLDEAKLKELTGGDLLEARRIREDPWQFSPSWTIFLQTNHRPRISGTDEGIWRRTRLVPWLTHIPTAEQDTKLAARLADEASGILNWIVAGAIRFADKGLIEPAAVVDASSEYRTDEDHVGRFLADRCDLDESSEISAQELRHAYEQWCSEIGENPWTPRSLGGELTRRGHDSHRSGKQRRSHWIGLTLKKEER